MNSAVHIRGTMTVVDLCDLVVVSFLLKPFDEFIFNFFSLVSSVYVSANAVVKAEFMIYCEHGHVVVKSKRKPGRKG